MASWTDKTPVFNPYVPQLPVETMAKVGMYKQQKYDEGIEKIQSSIDNVAGIDIIRDVDKEYLKTKLSQLQRKLRTVAGGDFSSTQLVNSVTGMTNSIVRDKYVTAAIQSTRADRKNLQEIAEAKKKGTGNPANTEFYYKQRKAYMDAGLQGEDGDPVVFNGFYSPFFDVDKHIRETFNALKPDNYRFDQIFQTDEDGNPLLRTVTDAKTGKQRQEYVLSDVMTQLKTKGMFPEKVRQTIDHIFRDPRVSQQLQISGEYAYKGYSSDFLVEKISENKERAMDKYDEDLSELNIKLSILEDPDKQKEQQDKINIVNEKKNKAADLYDKLLEAARDNPDYVRGSLYKEEVRNSYQSMYTNIEEERTVHSNPAMQHKIELQKMADDNTRHRETMGYRWAQLEQADRHFIDNLNHELELANIKADAKNKGGDAPTRGDVSATDILNMQDLNLKRASAMYNSLSNDLIFAGGAFGDEEATNALIDYYKENGGGTLDEIKDKIIRNKAREAGKDISEFKSGLIDKVSKNISLMPADTKRSVLELERSTNKARVALETYSDIFEEINDYSPLPDVKKDLQDIIININGKEMVLTPDMQYNLALASVGPGRMESEYGKLLVQRAQSDLEKQGWAQEAIEATIATLSTSVAEERTWGGSMIGTGFTQSTYRAYDTKSQAELNFLNFKDNISDKYIIGDVKRREEKAKEIYDQSINPVLKRTILEGTAVEKDNLNTKVANLIGFYKDNNQNTSSTFKKNSEKMLKIALGESPGRWELWASKDGVTGEVNPKIVFYGTSEMSGKGYSAEMDISLEEAYTLGPKARVMEWYTSKDVAVAQRRIGVIGKDRTSYGSPNSVSTYINDDVIYRKFNFSYLKNIPEDVKANIRIQKQGEAEVYYNHIYIRHRNEEGAYESYIYPENTPYYSLEEALAKLSGITPTIIETIIKTTKPKLVENY